jgi:predicted acyltransferase (DUF342 family)
MLKKEEGMVLPLALIVLAVGALASAPFLGLVGSSFTSSEVLHERAVQQFSADAGVEYGIWQVRSGTVDVPPGGQVTLPGFTINDQPVDVTVTDLGSRHYNVTSVASGEASSTTVSADAAIDALPAGFSLIPGDATFNAGDVVDDNLYIEGAASISGGAVMNGDIYAEGDISFTGGSNVVFGDVATGGDLFIAGGSQINGDVCVEGNLTMSSDATVAGNARVVGNITMSGQARIWQNAYLGGTVSLDGGAAILGSYPLPYAPCATQFFPNLETAVTGWDVQY